jgi:dolichyl-phosphate-mannose--protein O-mannosyl transferase
MFRRRAVALALCVALACASVVVAEPDTTKVTCGSTIKLSHANTKAKLHSHEIAYGSGSGQQSVTGVKEVNDGNSYWTVRAALGGTCVAGDVVKTGDHIRLQHVNTKRWLHSHLHKSPLSGNQEVSCFGDDDTSNVDDNWVVELQGGDTSWTRDKKVRLTHASTGVALHSHNQKYSRPITGQHEVCGAPTKDGNNLWIAEEGVYLPVRGSDVESDGERAEL